MIKETCGIVKGVEPYSEVEVMCDADGNINLYVTQSNKKYDGKRFYTQTVSVSIPSAEWAHICSVPTKVL